MPPFLVLKPDYPHESASNMLFTVYKGEILECPVGYKPSSSFKVCETQQAAQEYVELTYNTKKVGPEGSASISSTTLKSEAKSIPAYPLFRRVFSPDGSEQQYRLFARDVHRFLAREETEVLMDLQSINVNIKTASNILECEQKHFSRIAITDFLNKILTKDASIEPKSEDKEEVVKKSPTGVTSPETMSGRLLSP